MKEAERQFEVVDVGSYGMVLRCKPCRRRFQYSNEVLDRKVKYMSGPVAPYGCLDAAIDEANAAHECLGYPDD